MLTVKQNHEAPDLWGALKAQLVIPDAAARAEQPRPSTPEELKLLDAGLDDIEEYIVTTQPLDPAARGRVKRTVDYLRDAAHRGVQKVDWLNIFMGQLFELMLQRVLQPSFYAPLVTHAAGALGSAFQFAVRLLNAAEGV